MAKCRPEGRAVGSTVTEKPRPPWARSSRGGPEMPQSAGLCESPDAPPPGEDDEDDVRTSTCRRRRSSRDVRRACGASSWKAGCTDTRCVDVVVVSFRPRR